MDFWGSPGIVPVSPPFFPLLMRWIEADIEGGNQALGVRMFQIPENRVVSGNAMMTDMPTIGRTTPCT
jgi:hypothetical protein